MNRWSLVCAIWLTAAGSSLAAEPLQYRSHPPMRGLPEPSRRPLEDGPKRFVHPNGGDDRNDGTEAKPWKTLRHAVGRLLPGQTLCLRGGTYYESVSVSVSGTTEQPITIRAYPGELAVVDAGFREFAESPATAWEPVGGGAEGEFRSTRSYDFGGGFGNFGDSLVPFHRYMNFADLRSSNELYRPELGNRADDPQGIYVGPGVRRDPETGRIHIRLSHTRLEGLGTSGYQGETDPRKLPLVISGHDYALRIEGSKHVRIQDLVFRGAERSAVLIAEDPEAVEVDSQHIVLDGVTLYGSGSALRVSRTRNLRLTNSALRGHAAPWHSRFTHKNRAGAGYLVVAAGRDFEFDHCEFTDHHDGLHILFADELRLHHCLIDNFNDDGIEVGPKQPEGRKLIYQNFLSRCLNPFTLHGAKPVPVTAAPGSGCYIFRNVVDLRRGTYTGPPAEPDPTGKFLDGRTTLIAHDHGSPTWPVAYVYHNTFLMADDAWRDYYALTWGAHLAGTTRRVFNNIFVQTAGIPSMNFDAALEDDFQADGNLHWGVLEGPAVKEDLFASFRKSPLFAASRKNYPPGWAANDKFADPLFSASGDATGAGLDVRLRPGSPAIDGGVELPADWPDPLRASDSGKPDIGAFPAGAEALRPGLNK